MSRKTLSIVSGPLAGTERVVRASGSTMDDVHIVCPATGRTVWALYDSTVRRPGYVDVVHLREVEPALFPKSSLEGIAVPVEEIHRTPYRGVL